MSRAGSGTHALAPWRACLLRRTSVHAFILAGTTHLQICNSAHACLHAHKIRGAHTFLQTHLAQENTCKDSLSTARRLCKLLHLGACQGRGWEKEWRNRAHAFPFEFPPPPALLFFTQVSTGRGVKEDWGEGTWKFPARGTSPEPRDLHYLHPLIPRPGSSLSLRARAAGPNITFLRLGARGLLLPSRPPPPGRRAGARSRRELSGNPPRGGWPGALTSS